MATIAERMAQLRAALAAQEGLRPLIGAAAVAAAVEALQARLAALAAEAASTAAAATGGPAAAGGLDAGLTAEQALAGVQRHLPPLLAAKVQAARTIRHDGERRLATVLFADLSGFTALGERRDPEVIREFQSDLFDELAAAVYEYEGFVENFMGDAVLASFGAPVAHEDDPERALRAALAMRERMAALNRRWAERLGQPLTLHIGLDTGTVVAGSRKGEQGGEYDLTGDTVNTAARLQRAAAAGQILVGLGTYRQAHEAFTFAARGPLHVPGKREPVAVYELQRAKLHPGKTRGLGDLHGITAPFVGREAELGQLAEVAARLRTGEGRIVVLTGEAGVGKSRLLLEWRRQLHDQQGPAVRWIEGRAFSHTTGLAYGPFLDLFRRFAGMQDDDAEPAARQRLYAAAERLFPADQEARALLVHLLAMRLSPEEQAVLARYPAEALQQRVWRLVEAVFTRLAEAQPTVLVIEDLHWADQTSLDLLEHLLPLTERLPFAFAGVARPQDGTPAAKLQATITSRFCARATHLALAPLPEDASLALVQQVLGTPDPPPALRALILGKAEGNPFFVEEVIRDLIERGALVRAPRGEGWVTTPLVETVTVPDTLQGVLMARLDRLPHETKWVVQHAAVIGRIFLYRVLQHMAEQPSGLEADLGYLEREEIIRERTRDPELEYIFKHALTQEVAYASLLATRRRELHGKAGRALEALFAGRLPEFYSVLGDHFFRGECWDEAYDYGVRAGDAAARQFAQAEARLHYARALAALAHLPDTEDTRRRRVDTTVKQVRVSFYAHGPQITLQRLRAVEPVAHALCALDGQRPGDGVLLARVQYWLGRVLFHHNQPREALGYYRRLMAVAPALGDPELIALPAAGLGRLGVMQGRFGQSIGMLTQGAAALAQTGNWTEWAFTNAYLGAALAATGRCAEGSGEGERALQRAKEINNATCVAGCYLVLAGLHLFSGEAERQVAAGRAAFVTAEGSEDRQYQCVGWGHYGWGLARAGRLDEAEAAMARYQAIAGSLGGVPFMVEWFAAAHAELAWRAGRLAEAIERAEQATALAHTVGGTFAEGEAQGTWGLALAQRDPGRWDEAVAHLAEGLRLLDAGECVLEAARLRVAWGRLCAARGDDAGAREHFQQAKAQFARADRPAELAAARALLRRLRAGARQIA